LGGRAEAGIDLALSFDGDGCCAKTGAADAAIKPNAKAAQNAFI
jgi:hypothetical protein